MSQAHWQRGFRAANPDYDTMENMMLKSGSAVEADASFTAADEAFFADGSHQAAVAKAASTAEEMTGSIGARTLGTGAAGLGLYGAYKQIGEGMDEWKDGRHLDGGLDVGTGMLGAGASGLGLVSSLAGGAAMGGSIAAASALAAPIAGVAGLEALGQHEGEKLGRFGQETDADGKSHNRGALDAALDTSMDAGHAVENAVGGGVLGRGLGAATAGISGGVLETGAIVANLGLGAVGLADGVNDLASTTGWFGKNDKGEDRGAYGLLNDTTKAAGADVTNAVDGVLGHDGVGGAVGAALGGAVHYGGDVLGAGMATVADVGAGIYGASKKLWDWI